MVCRPLQKHSCITSIRNDKTLAYGMQVQYDTGDHVAVLPENGPETVAAAAATLGLPLDTVFQLRLPPGNPQQLSLPFPGAHCSSGMLSSQRHQQDCVNFWLLYTILRCGNLQQQVSPPSLGAGQNLVRDSSFADTTCMDARRQQLHPSVARLNVTSRLCV